MKTKTGIVMLALLASGCASQLTLIPAGGGPVGTGTLNTVNDTVVVSLNGKSYQGNVVRAKARAVTTYTSNERNAKTGTAVTNVDTGQGRMLLTAGDGSSINCEFTEDGMNGIGACRDSAGKRYDLKMQLQF